MSFERKPAWYVGAALVALGRHRADDTAMHFTLSELSGWVQAFPRPSTAKLATDILVIHKLVEALPSEHGQRTRIPARSYRLTADGALAARSALQSDQVLHPAAYGSGKPSAAPVDPFAQRLWSLLRIRRAVTADDAASTLVDAGEDVARARRKAGELLLAWSRLCPAPVQISAKRIAGCKRYVLIVDTGLLPPVIPTRSRA